MELGIKLNLDKIIQYTFSYPFVFDFLNITNLRNWYDELEQPNVTQLELNYNVTNKKLYVFLNGDTNLNLLVCRNLAL